MFSEDDKLLIYKDIERWNSHWLKYKSQVVSERRSMVSFRNYISLGKTQDISSEKGIALLTVHMSKGLQFEVVFVVGLMEGTFPDYRSLNELEISQEKNDMFVAATRAKRLCYFSYSDFKQMPWGEVKEQNKSRFLDGLPIIDISQVPNNAKEE